MMHDLPQRIRMTLIYALPLLWTLLLIITLNLTNPLQGGPAGVLLVFCLIYLVLSSFLFMVVDLAFRAYGFLRRQTHSSGRRVYYVTSTLALGPVFMLALNTLGSLDWQEVLLVLLFVCAGCFYVIRQTRSS